MPRTYLPTTDAGLLNWATNFATRIGGDPEGLGLTLAQATAYAALQADYAAKLTAATEPDTRGGSTIQAKNNAKKLLVAESRRLAMLVTNFTGVTDQQRYDLGLTVRDKEPTPVPVPTTVPEVIVRSVEGRLFNLQLKEPGSEGRGKPTGVRSAWLYAYVGESAPSFGQMKFHGEAGRTYTQIVMAPDVEVGSKVWISACWVNRSGKPGAVSIPVQTWTNHGAMQNVAA